MPLSSTGIWFSSRPLAAAVDLAVGLRVGAEVVRGEGELPAVAGGVVHERHEERLGQRGAEQQELRRHRIEHVRGADAAVGVVLLAELTAAGRWRRRRTCPRRSTGDRPARRAWRISRRRPWSGRPSAPRRRRRSAAAATRSPWRRPCSRSAASQPLRRQYGRRFLLHVLDRVEIVVGEHQPAGDGLAAHLADRDRGSGDRRGRGWPVRARRIAVHEFGRSHPSATAPARLLSRPDTGSPSRCAGRRLSWPGSAGPWSRPSWPSRSPIFSKELTTSWLGVLTVSSAEASK